MKSLFLWMAVKLVVYGLQGISAQESTPVTKSSVSPFSVGLALGPGGLGDLSYNDMMYKGLVDAHAQFPIQVILGDPSTTGAEYSSRLADLAGKCGLVFCGNPFLTAPVVTGSLAARFPKVVFVLLDDDLDRRGLPRNVISTRFRQDEPSFIAGYLAASMSHSHRIGFLGGVDLPVVGSFLGGFEAGARFAAGSVAVDIEYISKKPDLSGFRSPGLAYQLATAMIRRGDDVIFSVAGGSGNGAIQACRDLGRYAIGVDTNQDYLAPGTVLTSVMKRLDIVVADLVGQKARGTLVGGRSIRCDYRNGGVSLTPMEFTQTLVPKDIRKEMAYLETRMEISNADGSEIW